MKPFNYVFIVVLIVILICSAVGIFFVGVTPKTITIILMTMAVSSVTSGIYHKFFIKEKEKDERNIDIENKAKAKAFDVMGIILGFLIIIYVFLKSNLLTISLVVIAYLLIFIIYIVYFSRYHKEM